MKNNIMAIAKSKKFMVISATIALAALLIMAGKFLGVHYYMFYLFYNLEDVAEIILKLGIFIAVISILIAFFFKKDNNNRSYNNSVINREENTEEKNNVKSGKLWLIPIIVTIAVLLLLFLAPRFLASGFYGMYMLHNLDDIIEGVFQLAISVAVIVFLAVFFKKIWNKL